jgi:hypothetical protein
MSINWERNFISLIIDYSVLVQTKKGDHVKIGGRPRIKTRSPVYSRYYIIPPISPPYPPPGGIGGIGFSSFGFSATIASVVNIRAATEAAF